MKDSTLEKSPMNAMYQVVDKSSLIQQTTRPTRGFTLEPNHTSVHIQAVIKLSLNIPVGINIELFTQKAGLMPVTNVANSTARSPLWHPINETVTALSYHLIYN
jgi:hypothetical protein